ncbi:hypothetical protein [uncultured Methylobacterium sp.]|jgi:hypothetical protein|uniref:hypothetical protein n=1 Tax=uncultured Methylobacterium sp. TaxID=157278 RepID=UPI00261239D4|nr:hypothetical protein [uncultured Methylobacterium sp.]
MRRGGWLWGAVLLALCGPAGAADLLGPLPPPAVEAMPRYFPRGDGEPSPGGFRLPRPVVPVRCPLGYGTIPTNAPEDPSYVGSAYGLSKPSYYGFTPPLGVDDPYGRRLRPCS